MNKQKNIHIRHIYTHVHNLAESRIFSVTVSSSSIDIEFVASIENEEVSATIEKYQLLILVL